jgi:microcystin-dependent protein
MPAVNTIQLRRDTAANWTSVNPVLAAGEIGFETNTRLMKAGDATTAWATLPYLNFTPAGVISQFAGSAAPSGYVLCEGQSLSTATFPTLFAAIGYTYGGSGANFTVPNLKGRVPVGRDSAQTEFDVLGEASGVKSVTLTVDQMPSHTHTQDSHNHGQNPHSHFLGLNVAADANSFGDRALPLSSPSFGLNHAISNATATNQPATAVNQNTGGGQAHTNLQPYIVVNYIIKT